MIRFIRRLSNQFKEYLLLTILIVVSFYLISNSEKPQAKQLKVYAFVAFATIDEAVSSILSIFHKDESYEELQRENAHLMLQLNKYRNAVKQTEELNSLLSLRDTSNYQLIPASVISKLVTKFQGNFIINRGNENGIIKGMPVINDQGLVGLVMDVTQNFATIRTLHNVNLNIAITVQRSKVDGILSYNGRELIIKDVPTTYDVQVGDSVYTSDFSSIFPPKIPVGVIQKKYSNALGLLHNLTVKTFSSIEGATNLFVVKILPNKQIKQLEMNLMKKP